MLEQKQMFHVEPFGEGPKCTPELRDALRALQELDWDMYATIVDAADSHMEYAHNIGCANATVADYNMQQRQFSQPTIPSEECYEH